MKFDPRTTPARADLAADHLKGRVEADRFAKGAPHYVVEPTAPLHRAPASDAPLETEALHGEEVTVYETGEEGWSWVQLKADGYVGYLPANALIGGVKMMTHRVTALHAIVFPGPDIKAPPVAMLPFGSRVKIELEEKGFAATDDGGFISVQHLAPLASLAADFVATARRFRGSPYLWGGRTSLGVDCSGLVQLSLQAAGIECPRDSDMQTKLGTEVPFTGDLKGVQRGDLICWQGHIGIVSEQEKLLHANAFHMATVEEPLASAVERVKKAGSEVIAVRRLKG